MATSSINVLIVCATLIILFVISKWVKRNK